MKKLVILNVVGLLVAIGLAVTLVSNARSAKALVLDMKSFTTVQVEAGEIRTNMIAMSDAMRGYLLDTSVKTEADKKQAADDALVESVEHLLASTSDQQFASLASRIGELDETQLDIIEDEILSTAATDAPGATKAYFARYMPVRVKQMAMVDELQALARTQYLNQVDAATAAMDRTISNVIWLGGGVTIIMLGAFGWSVATSLRISRQMSSETVALGEMAGGVLLAAEEVARMSESLSQGATEQAASLEETSASMEEIASMTRQNAEHTEEAAKLMAEVDGRVRESNHALEEMQASMHTIQESGREVAKIIKTIDEIAFQTNILALNAAVESARAGEAGLGFAVVADEVRTLAQRSAQAARDTAGLIEASMSHTEDGGRRVDLVARAIGEITTSVAHVKGLVEQVSTASRQQTDGFRQVSSAIAQMESVTQSTAAAAEESAAASEELKSRARSSSEVVIDLQRLMGLQCSVTAPEQNRPIEPAPAPARQPARMAA